MVDLLLVKIPIGKNANFLNHIYMGWDKSKTSNPSLSHPLFKLVIPIIPLILLE